MILTNGLLAAIALLLIIIICTIQEQNRKINALLDALAEMTGDLLRELITKIEGKKKP